MKKTFITSFFLLGISIAGFGQVQVIDSTQTSIPMLESSAILQLDSEDKGLLIPRAEKENIDATTNSTTASGMITYDPSENAFYLKVDDGWIKLN